MAERQSIPDGFLKLSYSSMGTYQSCPLRFKYGYVDQIPSPQEPQQPLVFGNALHDTLARFYQQPDPSKERLLSIWDKTHREAYHKDGFDIFSPGILQQSYQEGQRQLDSIWNRFEAEGRLDVNTRVELRFYWHLPEAKTVFKGFIDALFAMPDGNDLLDYKCGKWQYRQAELLNNQQLLSYYGYCTSRDVAIARCGIYMTRHDEILWTTFSSEQVKDLEKEIAEVSEDIRSEKFEARPGLDSCRWCAYTSICPEVHHKYRPKSSLLDLSTAGLNIIT